MRRRLLMLTVALTLSFAALLTSPSAWAYPPACDCYYCSAVSPDSPCDFGGVWGVYTCGDFLNYYSCW